jgi:hypothetical protein
MALAHWSVLVMFSAVMMMAGISCDEGIEGGPQSEPLYPTDDSYVYMNDEKINYGTATEMLVRNRYGDPGESRTLECDALVLFDLSSISNGTTITSAELYLYYANYSGTDPVNRVLKLYRLTDFWEEDSVTWARLPDHDPQETATSTVPENAGTWMKWEVAEDVQDFVDGKATNYGWVVMDTDYWNKPNVPTVHFGTKEDVDHTPLLDMEMLTPAQVIGP